MKMTRRILSRILEMTLHSSPSTSFLSSALHFSSTIVVARSRHLSDSFACTHKYLTNRYLNKSLNYRVIQYDQENVNTFFTVLI